MQSNILEEFYQKLLIKKNASVKEYFELFGPYALEEEESLFWAMCDTINNFRNCIEILNTRMNVLPDSFNSIGFELLKDKSNILYPFKDKSNYTTFIKSSLEKYYISISNYYLVLKLDEKKFIYFNIFDYGNEKYIQDIYLPDGKSIFNSFPTRSYKKLKLKSVINDPDGYTNIRKSNNLKSSIVGILKKDQIFYTKPNFNENWWEVYNLNGDYLGYVFHSRIKFVYDK